MRIRVATITICQFQARGQFRAPRSRDLWTFPPPDGLAQSAYEPSEATHRATNEGCFSARVVEPNSFGENTDCSETTCGSAGAIGI
jgi:hypothetical protein